MLLVTGGTGFIGSHLIDRLRQLDIAVRAVVRHPSREKELRSLGVDVVPGDIADAASLKQAAHGCDRVIHLVGIIQEARGATFRGVHVEGTRNVLAAAKAAGARQFLFLSALGTRPGAKSAYHKTKWEAEELVRASGIPFTILRPSLVYGAGDLFTLRLSNMIRLSPALPVVGSGASKIQPLHIDDLISCIVKAVSSDAFVNEMYELGGPEQLTYKEVTTFIAEAMGVRRPVLHLPLVVMKAAARAFEIALPTPPVTTDQLIMLQEDTICPLRDMRDAFGVEPVRFREGLRRFLRKAAG